MATAAPADVCVACTAPELLDDRGPLATAYDANDGLPIDCSVRTDLQRLELVGTLRAGHDLVHLVGHVDEAGIRCADGHLDPDALGPVDVEAFVLNACSSVAVGERLVAAGASGGIATDRDVGVAGAARIDQGIAAALARGADLETACSLAEAFSVEGSSYVVVGNGATRPVE